MAGLRKDSGNRQRNGEKNLVCSHSLLVILFLLEEFL